MLYEGKKNVLICHDGNYDIMASVKEIARKIFLDPVFLEIDSHEIECMSDVNGFLAGIDSLFIVDPDDTISKGIAYIIQRATQLNIQIKHMSSSPLPSTLYTKVKSAGLFEKLDPSSDIKLPVRSTSGSAGYDFFAPEDILILPQSHCTISSGIRAFMNDGWVLCMFPRSGLGFKHGIRLENTVGIIDSDYYGNESNGGEIVIKLYNPADYSVEIEKGQAFCQGIFLQFGKTLDDCAEGERSGGFGSTDRGGDAND